MLVKLYVAIMVMAMFAIGLVGAFSLKRCGCRVYERYNLAQARYTCCWGSVLGSLFMTFTFIAMPLVQLGYDLASRWNWSEKTGLGLAIVLAYLMSGLWGLLAIPSFNLGREIARNILSDRQAKQRIACRELQKQMASVDFRNTACEDLLARYVNCCKQIAIHCDQPGPTECPVGVWRRRIGYIDAADVRKAMDDWTAEQSGQTADQFKIVSVPFVSYYDSAKTILLPAPAARDLRSFVNNFVDEDQTHSA